MNWGKGITLFIIAFIATMLFMVYIAFKQSNEMIEDNYYDREVKYQEIIDAKKNLEPLMNQFILADSSQFIWLQLPAAASRDIKNGQLRMIKMDRASADNTLKISQAETKIDKSAFLKGTYHIKLNWDSDGKTYFYEGDLMIN
jgi:regulatory protein YycI of two-component signal transduction system YycFG